MKRGLRPLLALLPLALTACATTGGGKPAPVAHVPPPSPASTPPPRKVSPYPPAQEDPSKRGDYVAGGLFRPGVPDSVPDEIPDVDAIPEPEVRDEPRAPTGNRDYVVLGKQYRVLDDASGYVEEGIASYYGNKFHRRRTSSGEVYDMYAFTAAHKTLPLPSFARVTNLENGKSVIVRVNDRGPFHPGRVIDLSYAAAVKLGYRDKGSARVRVEALTPVQGGDLAQRTKAPGSALDDLVARLPAAPGPASGDDGNRLRMADAERPRSADEFDAWMRARAIRIATGKPAVPAAAAPSESPEASSAPPAASLPPAASAASALPTAATGSVWQIASFSDRRLAEQALARLRAAAIDGAHLQDADVNGRKVWRLRLGPVSDDAAGAELATRIAGLGFGRPQRVRN
ncbi:septal ring lytic transglycosylase RlpA family protein [Thermomonas alba]|uniref:septal ring lytic transglycosylase RlpA family protein n=1 Tax=Thermomonas alba TaxID=2888525 RepID=UPI001F03362E|nr:septal ring lytic transglycosylase RlpA family protein [Thermomonas alba]